MRGRFLCSGLVLFLSASALQAGDLLRWRKSSGAVRFQQGAAHTLREALQVFLEEHAESANSVRFHPLLPEQSKIRQVQGRTAQGVWDLVLERNALHALERSSAVEVLPRREVWRHQPVRKLITEPTPLGTVLEDLSLLGWIPLTFTAPLPEGVLQAEPLEGRSVAAVLEQLAARHQAQLRYDASGHRLYWTPNPERLSRFLPLPSIQHAEQLRQLLQSPELSRETQGLEVSFPKPEVLLLQGPRESVESLQAVLQPLLEQPLAAPVPQRSRTLIFQHLPFSVLEQHLEQGSPSLRLEPHDLENSRGVLVTLSGPADQVESLSLEWQRLDNELLLALPESEVQVRRFPLQHLRVSDDQVFSNGAPLKLPGVLELLRGHLEQAFQQDPLLAVPQLLADPLGNALIVRGTPEVLGIVEALLQAWDRPHPQIQIEAHIFETTEQDSQRIGLEFNAQNPPGNSNLSVDGPFTLGATLVASEATTALQVDALLRLLQQEGRGRMLSRPVIVTTNNVEAEVNSGSRINIRLYENKSLQELQTGVTLQVTPRLVGGLNEEEPGIELHVRAETSSPSNTQSIDGIPVINTQRVQSRVTVPDGRPFLLSGLIKSSQQEREGGVPLLRDLPLLGVLFQSQGQERRFDHVLIMITPRLIREPQSVSLPDVPEATQDLLQP